MNANKVSRADDHSVSLFGLGDATPHERVMLVTDEKTGLRAIIAIHSTARGPAFGGCRYWSYGSDLAAMEDALRLSRGMSLKNAMADLPFGGGKAVILRGDGQHERKAMYQSFGRAVQGLSGTYITGEDVGTSVSDMLAVREVTPYAAGIPRPDGFGGNPSPKTALGVFAAIERGALHVFGAPELSGLRVAVQGLGAVGWALAERLHRAGCKLVVADIDDSRTAAARRAFNAVVVAVDDIATQDVDILAPCALGATLHRNSIPALHARLVAGAANNQLATNDDGDALHERGIAYLPDYLVNAGGIISCVREYEGGFTEADVDAEVLRIADRVDSLFVRASKAGEPLSRAADHWALEKLAS